MRKKRGLIRHATRLGAMLEERVQVAAIVRGIGLPPSLCERRKRHPARCCGDTKGTVRGSAPGGQPRNRGKGGRGTAGIDHAKK